VALFLFPRVFPAEEQQNQYCPEDGFKDSANPMRSKGLNAVLVFFDLKSEKSKTAFSEENR
jgi:hypothetical protein